MIRLYTLITLLLCISAPDIVFGGEKTKIRDGDNHQDCKKWATMGECENNPGYMRVNCIASCNEEDKKVLGTDIAADVAHIKSFFTLQANDIDGKPFQFMNLRDKVTVIINVASHCGYTESHYRGLVELYNSLKDTNKFEILAFPSNQFGEQEPEQCSAIKRFAEKKGAEFRMMYKIDVNGDDAHIVYKYLKSKAGPLHISWNFATYFVSAPDGNIRSYSGVEPMDLKDLIEELIGPEEL
mmetsp:Transcript_18429/g.22565  ORF Transcript_18429/g.22565 Transcript_18429/m.22565 type:complete len:240 (-) Transcript_18429:358-1077(-)